MGEFHFTVGTGRGKVTKRVAEQASKIGLKHGATFVFVTLPGDGPRHWFAARGYGHPFDNATAKAVREELAAEGVVLP